MRAWRLATCVLAACATAFGAPKPAVTPWEPRFLDELLTPGPTRWTSEFDAYKPDSYVVQKIALARVLAPYAAKRGRNLRALIVVGPTGTLWTYYVIAVFDEGGWLRVNEIVMPHARIVGKRTGVVERGDLDRTVQKLIDSGVAIPVGSLDELTHRLDRQERIDWQLRTPKWKRRTLGDFRFDLLVVTYEGNDPSFWYGKLDSSSEQAVELALSAVNALVRRTRPSYEHGQASSLHSFRHSIQKASADSPARGRIYLHGMLAHDPQPDILSALAHLGYTSFGTTQPAFGIGFGAVVLRARVAVDIVAGTHRAFVGPRGESGALSRSSLIFTAGFDVWDDGQVAVYPFAGVAGSGLLVRLDRGATGPFPGSSSRTAEEQRYMAQQTIWLAGLGLDHVVPFAPRTERHRGGLDVGMRVGLLFGSDTTRWTYLAEKECLDVELDGPRARLGGVFGILELGFGDLR